MGNHDPDKLRRRLATTQIMRDKGVDSSTIRKFEMGTGHRQVATAMDRIAPQVPQDTPDGAYFHEAFDAVSANVKGGFARVTS